MTPSQEDQLISHAHACLPEEACAILGGIVDADMHVVREIIILENIDHSPVSFSISGTQLIRAYEQADRLSIDIIGVFHSHPGSAAIPSLKDRRYMEINAVIWPIYSVIGDTMRAWISDGGIYEVPVVISQVS